MTHAIAFMMLLAAGAATETDEPVINGVHVQRIASASKTELGTPIAFPAGPGQVTATVTDLPPGSRLPVHKHPFNRYTYLLAGKLRVNYLGAGRSVEYQTGQFVIETAGEWHYGEVVGDVPVRILTIDETSVGKTNMILRTNLPGIDPHEFIVEPGPQARSAPPVKVPPPRR